MEKSYISFVNIKKILSRIVYYKILFWPMLITYIFQLRINICVLHLLMANSSPNFTNKILFIFCVACYYHSVDPDAVLLVLINTYMQLIYLNTPKERDCLKYLFLPQSLVPHTELLAPFFRKNTIFPLDQFNYSYLHLSYSISAMSRDTMAKPYIVA